MALSSHQLDAFHMVAQELSFSRAAERLHVTQSALSQRVINLEEELGITLFIRDRAKLQLTEEAFKLLRYCQTKNTLENETLAQINSSNRQRKVIRVGGFSSITRSLLIPALANLVHGDPTLKLNIMARELRDLPEMLRSSELDYIVVDSKIDREDLSHVLLGYEENVLVKSKKYAPREVYLDHDEDDETTLRYLKLLGKKSLNLNRMYLDEVYGLLDGVKKGLGYSVLPKHLIRDHKDLNIVNPHTVLKIPIYLHFYAQSYYPRIHQSVIDALEKYSKKIFGFDT